MACISIIITSHNLGRYLDSCLSSLKAQTFQDFEVLIVDDASTDETRDIIGNWCKKEPNIFQSILLNENLGAPGLVRNVALDSGKITGDYVLFLDGDDSYEAAMLEKMYYAAKPGKGSGSSVWADVVVCAYNRIDEFCGKVLSTEMRGFPPDVNLPNGDGLLAYVNTASWNKLWKRSIIQELRYSDFKVGEEVIFTYRAYDKSRRITFIDDILIHYMVRANSVISNTQEEDIWGFADKLRQEWKEKSENNQKIFEIVIFVHIGLSMALRAADNTEIDLNKHINDTRNWFRNEFNWFNGNKFFRLPNMVKHGIKGLAIWVSYWMYRLRMFGIVVFIYRKLSLNVRF